MGAEAETDAHHTLAAGTACAAAESAIRHNGDMRWRKAPAHKLVPVADVRRLTGLGPDELGARGDIQRFTRIDESGGREELARVPIELFLTPPDDEQPGDREE